MLTLRPAADDTIGSSTLQLRKRGRAHSDASGSDSDGDGDDDDSDGGGGDPVLAQLMLARLQAQMAAAVASLTPCSGCGSLRAADQLRRLTEERHLPASLPDRALGNGFETAILTTQLAQSGSSLGAMVREALSAATDPADTRFRLPAPRGAPPGAPPADPAAQLCERCYSDALFSLAYQYRASLPRSELPQSVTSRPSCWYGHECRTQRRAEP